MCAHHDVPYSQGMKWVSTLQYGRVRGVAVLLGAGCCNQGGWKANAVREGFRKVEEQPSRPSTLGLIMRCSWATSVAAVSRGEARMSKKCMDLNRFSKPLKTLGEGTYGTVYLCVDKAAPDGPCYVAIKSFKSQELEEQAKALAVREAKLLAAVRGHPNIVHLHHAYMTRSGQLYLVQSVASDDDADLEKNGPAKSKVKKGSSDGAWVSKQKYGITDSMRKDHGHWIKPILGSPDRVSCRFCLHPQSIQARKATVDTHAASVKHSNAVKAAGLSPGGRPFGTIPLSPAALPLSPAGTARVDKIAMRHAKQQLSAVEAAGCRVMTLEDSYAQAAADPETRLAGKAIEDTPVISKLNSLSSTLAHYFCRSPKRQGELRAISRNLLGTDVKVLRRVPTRWVSLLSPLRRILRLYSALVQLFAESEEPQASAMYDSLMDIEVLLGLHLLLPMLQLLNSFIKLCQQRDVGVLELSHAVQQLSASVTRMYINESSRYNISDFPAIPEALQRTQPAKPPPYELVPDVADPTPQEVHNLNMAVLQNMSSHERESALQTVTRRLSTRHISFLRSRAASHQQQDANSSAAAWQQQSQQGYSVAAAGQQQQGSNSRPIASPRRQQSDSPLVMDFVCGEQENLSLLCGTVWHKAMLKPPRRGRQAAAGPVDEAALETARGSVEKQLTSAALSLTADLESRFPPSEQLSAFALLTPSYWWDTKAPSQADQKAKLQALTECYAQPKALAAAPFSHSPLSPMLDSAKLYQQLGSFQVAARGVARAMKAQLEDMRRRAAKRKPGTRQEQSDSDDSHGSDNGGYDVQEQRTPLLSEFWKKLHASMASQLSEFCKAATLLIVTVPGSVEEERSFSAMNFIKDERRNSLSANLSSTLRVYLDKTFTLKTFPYKEAIDYWMAGASARGRYLGHREYVENSLAQQLEVHSPKGLPHGMACSIIRQLLEALAFMHSRSVTHRDIKMANVLLRNDGCVKLCDFGMATSLAPAIQPGGGPGGLQPSDSTAEAQLTSYVVTRWYRSPEVLLEQPYNEGVDVWSVGCLFAELLFNRPLYPGRSHIDQLALVAAGTAMILPEHLATLRANYRMCGVDIPLPQPSTAQGATQLQQQAAVYQRMSGMLLPAMREFLAATLHPDPLLRATAAELLQLPIMQTAQRVPAVPGPSLPPAAAVLKQLEEAEAAKAEATGQATGAKQPVVKPSRSMRRGVEEGIPAAVPAEQRGLASVRCEPEAPGFSASRAACASPPPPHSLSPMLASRHADKVDGQRSPAALRAMHDPNRSRTPDRSLLRVPSAGRRSSQSPLVAPSSQSPATSRHTSPACRHSYTPNGRPTSARPLRGQSDLNTRLLRSSLSSTSVVIEGSGAGNALGHGVEVQAAVPGLRAPVSGRRSHMQHSAGSQPPDSSSAAKEGLSLASLLLPARSPGREARIGPAPWDETEGKSAGPSSCEKHEEQTRAMADMRALSEQDQQQLQAHLEVYHLACPISNAPVESLLQLLKHGTGMFMELPALLELMSMRTHIDAIDGVNVLDFAQRLPELRKEVWCEEAAAAMARRMAKAEMKAAAATHRVGQVVVDVGDHEGQHRLSAAYALTYDGRDYSHTTVEEAEKLSVRELQAYLRFHQQELMKGWLKPKLKGLVMAHICNTVAALHGDELEAATVKAMVDKKRGVKANCANVQKAREVTAQRRAAEAAGPIEIGAQAGVIAAEAQAQADAGADEADVQLHQLQADLQHRELQLAHNQRMQQLQQQLQDLQRSELQRKEQQLADLVAQQGAALLQWEHQLTERQHQLQQQQVDLSRREQALTERKHQLQQQQADLNSREQQQARIQTLTQQLHSLQQELKGTPWHHTDALALLDEYQAAAAAIAAAAVGAVLRAAVQAEGQGQQVVRLGGPDLEALPSLGKEYLQGYKRVNDRLPKGRQRLHWAAEYRQGIDGRARNNAYACPKISI
ncbi:hypothetical protein QJQ45_027630 [Haematococcus lacustris]|nr:hypothetical protein QJQ45_027630 [Haematococcus lacustris]